MKIVIAGGTGFIGRMLVDTLVASNHSVVLLSRNPGAVRRLSPSRAAIHQWDGSSLGPWQEQMEDAGAVINLAGEPIAGGRWSRERKGRILRSRVNSTKILVEAIRQSRNKPKVLINGSAVGFYGAPGDEIVAEEYPPGRGFLPETCRRWEDEASRAEDLGLRVVRLRTGLVLGDDGGALQKMLIPFRFFVGGPIGSGRQWFPWVHRDDVVEIVQYAFGNPALSGPLNVVAPECVTMDEFCTVLGKAMGRPSRVRVPAFFVKALFGEMSQVLLTGQRVVPAKLIKAGNAFRFPSLKGALEDIAGR